MSGNRVDKISRLIQKEIADIFQKGSHSYFSGRMVTVTTVRVTPDLQLARVYASVFPGMTDKEFSSLMSTIAGQIRYELGKRIKSQLKKIPELQFFLDDSLDYIENIDNLLSN